MQILLTKLPDILFSGLLLGFVYAMIALGYTMVYGVLELINFAHSEIFMIGSVVGVEIFRTFAPLIPNGYLLLIIALVCGGLIAGFCAIGVERVCYRPLRKRGVRNRLVPLITAIGASFVLQDIVRVIEGTWHNEFNLRMVSVADLDNQLKLFGINVQVKSLILIGASVLFLVGLNLLVNRTRLGTAIRAVAQDADTARLMGINPDKIISRTFLIGGSLGGMAGVLFAVQYTTINPYVGFMPGIHAFTAAVLGGIGNISGAVVGGLVLGVIETLASTFLPTLTGGAVGSEYKDIIAFLILILFLLFRPQGLLGQVVKEKV